MADGCGSMFPGLVYFGLCFPKLRVPLITALGKVDLICFEGTKIEKGEIINVQTAAPRTYLYFFNQGILVASYVSTSSRLQRAGSAHTLIFWKDSDRSCQLSV